MGLGDIKDNSKSFNIAVDELAVISGQKPVVTTAKKSIANFKLRAGQKIGAKVTLRGKRMYEFIHVYIFIHFFFFCINLTKFIFQYRILQCFKNTKENYTIHKDLYFQNCLRCYGRQHQNNHSQKNVALYDYQYNVLKQDIISYYNQKKNCAEDNLMIIAQGILKHSYTITEIQQMFFQRMPHSVLFSKYVFNEYVQFLKRKGLVAQVVSAILYGSIYNKQLSKVILQFCQNNKYISKNLHNFSLLYNNFATYVNVELQYDNWFKKFFIKISNQKII